MTIITGPAGKGCMHRLPEKLGILGGMGIMTTLAGHDLGVNAKMGLVKAPALLLMTLRTQLVDRLVQEGDFLGSM